MDFPLFASLSDIVWTLVTFWLIWFGVGLVASLWVIRRAVGRQREERAEDAHSSVAHDLNRWSA